MASSSSSWSFKLHSPISGLALLLVVGLIALTAWQLSMANRIPNWSAQQVSADEPSVPFQDSDIPFPRPAVSTTSESAEMAQSSSFLERLRSAVGVPSTQPPRIVSSWRVVHSSNYPTCMIAYTREQLETWARDVLESQGEMGRSHGETLLELQFLAQQASSADANDPQTTPPAQQVTVLLPMEKETGKAINQLERICLQSHVPAQLWLLYTVAQFPQQQLLSLEFGQPIPLSEQSLSQIPDSCKHVPVRRFLVANSQQYLSVLEHVETSHVWIITLPTLLPGSTHLEHLLTVASLEKYQDVLLGTYGVFLDLPTTTADSTSSDYPVVFPSVQPLLLPQRLMESQFLFGSWFGQSHIFQQMLASLQSNHEHQISFMIAQSWKLQDLTLVDIQLNVAFCLYAVDWSWLAVMPVDVKKSDTWGDDFQSTTGGGALLQPVLQSSTVPQIRTMFAFHGIRFEPPSANLLVFVNELTLEEDPYLTAFRQAVQEFQNHGFHAAVAVISELSCSDVALSMDMDMPAACQHSSYLHVFQNAASMLRWLHRTQPSVVIAAADLRGVNKASLLKSASNQRSQSSPMDMTVIQLQQHEWSYFLPFATLDIHTLQNWNVPTVQLHLITHTRPVSLNRLCESLHQSMYFGDQVLIAFHVDAMPDEETASYVERFAWPYGPKEHFQRIARAGLMSAIVESWYPNSIDEYAIFLEDDVEVSPLFYLWTKWTLLKYRYGSPADRNPNLFGISLYSPRIQEMSFPRKRIDFETMFQPPRIPFLFQLPCSWGAVFFPEHWKEFHSYISGRLLWISDQAENKTIPTPGSRKNVIIPNSRSNMWQHSWKKYFIEMIMLRGYVMLYPNFENQTSFSTNHLEPGAHISRNSNVRRTMMADFEVPLMDVGDEIVSEMDQKVVSDGNGKYGVGGRNWFRQMPSARLPSWYELPSVDLFHQEKSLQELMEYGRKLASVQNL